MKCAHCGEEIKKGEIYVHGGLMNFSVFHLQCKALWDFAKAIKERAGF